MVQLIRWQFDNCKPDDFDSWWKDMRIETQLLCERALQLCGRGGSLLYFSCDRIWPTTINFSLCWRFDIQTFFDHLCDWVCYDLYYLDHDWWTWGHLDPSSGPFCPFLRCKSNTSKIYQNHCKNYGFGNMSLLEGTQIGSKIAPFLARKIIQKHVKHRVSGPPPPIF